jgi:hypothetical protein
MSAEEPPPEPWQTVDVWRSIWEALAISLGDDPQHAVARHREAYGGFDE